MSKAPLGQLQTSETLSHHTPQYRGVERNKQLTAAILKALPIIRLKILPVGGAAEGKTPAKTSLYPLY